MRSSLIATNKFGNKLKTIAKKSKKSVEELHVRAKKVSLWLEKNQCQFLKLDKVNFNLDLSNISIL